MRVDGVAYGKILKTTRAPVRQTDDYGPLSLQSGHGVGVGFSAEGGRVPAGRDVVVPSDPGGDIITPPRSVRPVAAAVVFARVRRARRIVAVVEPYGNAVESRAAAKKKKKASVAAV